MSNEREVHMSYLDEPFISKELAEIEFLQQRTINQHIFSEESFDLDKTIEYLHTLYALLDKQHVVVTRLSLTDDAEALLLKERLEDAAEIMGKPPGMPLSQFFTEMKEEVKAELRDLTGEDI